MFLHACWIILCSDFGKVIMSSTQNVPKSFGYFKDHLMMYGNTILFCFLDFILSSVLPGVVLKNTKHKLKYRFLK